MLSQYLFFQGDSFRAKVNYEDENSSLPKDKIPAAVSSQGDANAETKTVYKSQSVNEPRSSKTTYIRYYEFRMQYNHEKPLCVCKRGEYTIIFLIVFILKNLLRNSGVKSSNADVKLYDFTSTYQSQFTNVSGVVEKVQTSGEVSWIS